MKCGLLGRKLGHSYSPEIHAYLARYDYGFFEKEPEELADFLLHGDWHGINVTIPYKKTVIPYCQELTQTAQRLGAVNTIIRRSDGSLLGHNTDYFGLSYELLRSGLKVGGKKALVLGSGGASNTAVAILEEAGAQVVVISRSGENNYTNLDRHRDASVIVNASPVGMFPEVGQCLVDLDAFPKLEGVLDVIYNPARTQILLEAEKRGLVAINGLWMLVAQAKETAEWFTGHPIPDDLIVKCHGNLRYQTENIILIGMPGCGKSTVGRHVAQLTGRFFVDIDEEIEKTAGKTIPEIFEQDGEEAFRRMETALLAEFGKESALVISTGGGCVTREENYPLLHQNGEIFWLDRNIFLLPTEGRPLSRLTQVDEMYHTRKPMYRRFADHIVDNNSTGEYAAHRIVEITKELP